jgi:hypothetical protein
MTGAFHDDCYIVISAYGIQRMTKRPGKLAKGEVAVKVRFVVPTALFDDPEPSAIITIPESFAIHPEIEVEAVAPDQPD